MRSSVEEVIGVLNGWKDDERHVEIFLTTDRGGFIEVGGNVVDATPGSVEVSGEGCSVKVFFAAATEFDWSDPREAPLAHSWKYVEKNINACPSLPNSLTNEYTSEIPRGE